MKNKPEISQKYGVRNIRSQIFLTLFFCLLPFFAPATTLVQFCTDQLTGQVINKPITIVPTANKLFATNHLIFAGLTITLTPSAGCATTNLMPGGYDCTIQGVSQSFTILVPDTNTTVLAADIIVAPTNATYPGASTAWSISASELRYAPQGTNWDTATAGQSLVTDGDGNNYYMTITGGGGGGGAPVVAGESITITTNGGGTSYTVAAQTNKFDLAGTAAATSNVLWGITIRTNGYDANQLIFDTALHVKTGAAITNELAYASTSANVALTVKGASGNATNAFEVWGGGVTLHAGVDQTGEVFSRIGFAGLGNGLTNAAGSLMAGLNDVTAATNALGNVALAAFHGTNEFDLAGTAAARATAATNALGTAAYSNSVSFQQASATLTTWSGLSTNQAAINATNAAAALTNAPAELTAKAIGAYRGTFLPSNLRGLIGWWKADSFSVADNTSITSWTDSSGQGNTATVASGSQQPVYKTLGINGLPSLQYAQASSTKLTVANFFTTYSVNTNFTFFIVKQSYSTNISTQIAVIETSGNWYDANAPADVSVEWNQAQSGYVTQTRLADPTNAVCTTFRFGRDIAKARINNIRTAFTLNPTAMALAGNLVIGSRPGFENLCWDGLIAEIVIYSNALSDADCTLVEGYLADKWQLGSKKARAVFDGASQTYGVGSTTQGTSYPQVVVPMIGGSQQWDAENSGITGQTSAAILSNAPAAFISQFNNPRGVYVLCAGDNDIAGGSSVTTAYSNTVKVMNLARASGYATVIVTLVPALRVHPTEAERLSFNALVRSNWTTFADAIADAGSDAIIGNPANTNNSTYWNGDFVHLGATGLLILATNHVAPAINRIFRPPAYVQTNEMPTVISTNFIGNGANITNIPATSLTGIIPTNRLSSVNPTAGQVLAWNGVTNVWTNAGAGTVTSVGLSLPAELTISGSPVTGSGTLTGVWASQSASNFFAGGLTVAGTPAFRTIAATDLPAHPASLITSGTIAAARLPGPLFSFGSGNAYTNNGSGETIAFTNTLAAGQLSALGQSIHFVFTGTNTSANVTRTFNVYFGATQIANIAVAGANSASRSWKVIGDVYYVNTNLVACDTRIDISSVSTSSASTTPAYSSDATETVANALGIGLTIKGSSTGDITNSLGFISYNTN